MVNRIVKYSEFRIRTSDDEVCIINSEGRRGRERKMGRVLVGKKEGSIVVASVGVAYDDNLF